MCYYQGIQTKRPQMCCEIAKSLIHARFIQILWKFFHACRIGCGKLWVPSPESVLTHTQPLSLRGVLQHNFHLSSKIQIQISPQVVFLLPAATVRSPMYKRHMKAGIVSESKQWWLGDNDPGGPPNQCKRKVENRPLGSSESEHTQYLCSFVAKKVKIIYKHKHKHSNCDESDVSHPSFCLFA